MQTPPAAWKAFGSRKFYYGVLLPGIVDTLKHFTWIRLGFPGSLGDSRAYEEGESYERKSIVGSRVLHPSHVILSHGGFVLEYWLLKPYPQQQRTPRKKFYNNSLSSTRAVVANGSGRLKGR